MKFQSICHLCTEDACSRALLGAIEFCSAALVWTCGCWLSSWSGWRSDRKISRICLTARSKGNIVKANITSVTVTTNTFKYHLKNTRKSQCNHVHSLAQQPSMFWLDSRGCKQLTKQKCNKRSAIKPGSFCWKTTAPPLCSKWLPVNPLCSRLSFVQCHSGNS